MVRVKRDNLSRNASVEPLRARILLSDLGEARVLRAETATGDGGTSATSDASVREGAAALPGHRTVDGAGGTSPALDFEVDIEREALQKYFDERQKGVYSAYNTIARLKADLGAETFTVKKLIPHEIFGRLALPDGSPAAGLHVMIERPEYKSSEKVTDFSWKRERATTDAEGAFRLDPPQVPIPERGLTLRVRGREGSEDIILISREIRDGDLGVLILTRVLKPVKKARSEVVSAIAEIVPPSADEIEEKPGSYTSPAPTIRLGEKGAEWTFSGNDAEITRRRFAVLFRLFDPHLGSALPELQGEFGKISITRSPASLQLLSEYLGEALGSGTVVLRDRRAIDAPIDVTDFRSQIEAAPSAVPRASTLGIGYFVGMRQTWKPAGFSLGNLVYSLPLAPGEEQRIIVQERGEELSVTEEERLTNEERQRYKERADSSIDSVFSSSARETAEGGSSMNSVSNAWGVGGGAGVGGYYYVLAGLGLAGGYGQSGTQADSQSWQKASRDSVSAAAESMHSNVGREAAARRSAQRTGMRLARASESESVTTRIVANHNHNHALTMQYWEVLRHYEVRTNVDDVQLACFIPMELVPWLGLDQPRELPDKFPLSRESLVHRYRNLLRYVDVIEQRLRRSPEHRQAVRLVKQLAADPTMQVSSQSSAQTMIHVNMEATMLPGEELRVRIVTKDRRKTSAVRLTGASVPKIEQKAFTSWSELYQHLRERRDPAVESTSVSATVLLPPRYEQDDISYIEIFRSTNSFSYTINPFGEGGPVFSDPAAQTEWYAKSHKSMSRTFNSDDLNRIAGPVRIFNLDAKLASSGLSVASAFSGVEGAFALTGSTRIGVNRIPPMLDFADVLRIEQLFQLVIRNGVEFSRAVWAALSEEERAILFERFTIGVPDDALGSEAEEIPLLKCVANQVIGFYGNMMVMPFHLPPELVESGELSTRDIQERLLALHKQGFQTPKSAITLPTRGVLGEAILGSANSSEKIDLTRFWNWKDSPHTPADKPADALANGSMLSPDVEAPAKLVDGSKILSAAVDALGQLKGQAVASALAEKLVGHGAQAFTGIPGMTGIEQLAAVAQENTKAAASAQKVATEGGVSMGNKAMEMLPSVMEASANYQKVTKGLEEKKEEKREPEARILDLAAKSSISGMNVVDFIGSHGSPGAAVAAAQDYLREVNGGTLDMTPQEKIALTTFMEDLDGGSDTNTYTEKLGAWALLTAAGIPSAGEPPAKPENGDSE